MIQDRKLRSIMVAEDTMFWLDFYFTDAFGTPESYQDIIDWIDSWGNIIWFWYRWCAKTSVVRKRLCKRIALKQNKFIRWTSYDVSKSEDNITSISNMLIGSEHSPFVKDYGRLYYNESTFSLYKQKEQKRTSGFVTSNGVVVKANSVKKSTRWLNVFIRDQSLRPDLDILDDIDDDENTQNPKIISKTYNKVKGAIFGGGTWQKIILWNTINEDWVLPRLAEDYKNSKRRKIVYTKLRDWNQFSRPERFVKTQEEAEKINAKRPDSDTHVMSEEELYAEQGRDWFWANYMLVPLRGDVPIIEEQRIRYEHYQALRHGDKVFWSIDNAESEKDGSDPIGIVIGVYRPSEKKRWILHAERLKWRQKDQKRVEERLEFLQKQFKIEEWIIENKAWGITMRKNLIRRFSRLVHSYDPRKNTKIGRLRQVQPNIEGANAVFAPDIDQDFIKEMVKFPNVLHDDRVDAFTSLLLKMKNWLDLLETQNTKSIETHQKNDIPKQDEAVTKAQELINKYTPNKSHFTRDF